MERSRTSSTGSPIALNHKGVAETSKASIIIVSSSVRYPRAIFLPALAEARWAFEAASIARPTVTCARDARSSSTGFLIIARPLLAALWLAVPARALGLVDKG